MYQDTVGKLDVVGGQKDDRKMLHYLLQLTDRRYQYERMSKHRHGTQLPIEGSDRSKLHQKVPWYDAKYLNGATPG